MKRIFALLLTGTLALCGCGAATENKTVSTTSSLTESSQTSIVEYDNASLELLDASREIQTSDDGTSYIIVKARYTNYASQALYAYCSFSVKAFQEDTELTDISDINGEEASLIKEVKNGKSVDVSYCFQPTKIDGTPVEIQVCAPTAEQEVLLTKEYPLQAIDGVTE